jgi:hypothetical protein
MTDLSPKKLFVHTYFVYVKSVPMGSIPTDTRRVWTRV